MKVDVNVTRNNWISSIASVGLIAKAIVYILLGILAFMAAFEIGGQADTNANRQGVFNFVKEAPAGIWLLGLLSAGLICYSLWRGIQAFANHNQLKWTKRLRYLFSGLAYLSAAITALQIILHTYNNNGDKNRDVAARLLKTQYGPWLVGIVALSIA